MSYVPGVPVGTVEIVPSSPIRRMPRFPSAMKICPLGLTHTPSGPASAAAAAGPPSPHASVGAAHAWPLPATVVIVPPGAMRRTRCSPGRR